MSYDSKYTGEEVEEILNTAELTATDVDEIKEQIEGINTTIDNLPTYDGSTIHKSNLPFVEGERGFVESDLNYIQGQYDMFINTGWITDDSSIGTNYQASALAYAEALDGIIQGLSSSEARTEIPVPVGFSETKQVYYNNRETILKWFTEALELIVINIQEFDPTKITKLEDSIAEVKQDYLSKEEAEESYLGIGDTATNSDKLGGEPSTSYAKSSDLYGLHGDMIALKGEMETATENISNLQSKDTDLSNSIDAINGSLEQKLSRYETATNSDKLGGFEPSYYATKADLNKLADDLAKLSECFEVDAAGNIIGLKIGTLTFGDGDNSIVLSRITSGQGEDTALNVEGNLLATGTVVCLKEE